MSSVPWWLQFQVEPGNIDVEERARHPVPNPEGGYSTLFSMGVGDENGIETIIPQVVNGHVASPEEAIDYYRRTGQHLGRFSSVEAANAAAEQLHNEQAALARILIDSGVSLGQLDQLLKPGRR